MLIIFFIINMYLCVLMNYETFLSKNSGSIKNYFLQQVYQKSLEFDILNSNLNKQINLNNKKNQENTKIISQLKNELKAKEKEELELQIFFNNFNQKNKELENLTHNINLIREQIQQLKKEKKKIEDEIEEIETNTDHLQHLHVNLISAFNMDDQAGNAQVNIPKVNQKVIDRNNLKQQKEEKQTKLKTIQEDLNQAEKKLKELMLNEKERKKLLEQMEQLVKEKKELLKKIEKLVEINNQLTKENSELQKNIKKNLQEQENDNYYIENSQIMYLISYIEYIFQNIENNSNFLNYINNLKKIYEKAFNIVKNQNKNNKTENNIINEINQIIIKINEKLTV